jgi:hypothetical protein
MNENENMAPARDIRETVEGLISSYHIASNKAFYILAIIAALLLCAITVLIIESGVALGTGN